MMFIPLTCSTLRCAKADAMFESKMGSKHARKKECADSESTYNRKQRNLTCSDVRGLAEVEESSSWGLRYRQE